MLLSVKNINVYYGAIHAVRDISFEVGEGEIVTMIGANGAGKTTILQTVSGLLQSKSGSIEYNGQTIQNRPAYQILQSGLAQVPEGRRIFTELSVRENMKMDAFTRRDKAGVAENIHAM